MENKPHTQKDYQLLCLEMVTELEAVQKKLSRLLETYKNMNFYDELLKDIQKEGDS